MFQKIIWKTNAQTYTHNISQLKLQKLQEYNKGREVQKSKGRELFFPKEH